MNNTELTNLDAVTNIHQYTKAEIIYDLFKLTNDLNIAIERYNLLRDTGIIIEKTKNTNNLSNQYTEFEGALCELLERVTNKGVKVEYE